MSYNMSGSTKTVLALVVVIAIVIPIALGVVLIKGPLSLPSTTTAAASSTTSSSSSGAGGSAVTIPSGAGSGQNFSPSTLTVAAGTTVTFTNQDSVVHNVDFTSVPPGSSVAKGTTSQNLHSGNTYSVTLTTPGTYTYVCDFHTWMKGTITVTG
jgi:plastocyanin